MYLKKSTLENMAIGQCIAVPARHTIIKRVGKQRFAYTHGVETVKTGLATCLVVFGDYEYATPYTLTEGILDSLTHRDVLMVDGEDNRFTGHTHAADTFVDQYGWFTTKEALITDHLGKLCYVKHA